MSVQDPYALRTRAQIADYLDAHADDHRRLRRRNRFFRSEVNRLVAAQVPPNSSVLDIGCGAGDTLAMIDPAVGVGIDIDGHAIDDARGEFPRFAFHVGALEEAAGEEAAQDPQLGRFDTVIASGLLEHTYDVYEALRAMQVFGDDTSRFVIVTYSRLWQPLLRIAERMRWKASFPVQNWVPAPELRNLAEQAGLEVITSTQGVLIPFRIPGISRWVNRWLAPLPILRLLSMVHLTVLRIRATPHPVTRVSVVIPARNEAGHIPEILDRLPLLAPEQEVILIEGNSTDDTWSVIVSECEQRGAHAAKGGDGGRMSLVPMRQPGKGKGDAVRAAFASATGDVLIILDADISVPPEELPKFIDALGSGTAEFANGSRLVYDMEGGAMRFLNLLGNRFFGALFSFLLGQPVRDTLCGTKALTRSHYDRIVANRARFGEFDPFGDFDLLFGAAALNLRIRDVPVHYKARTYGETNISRFRHGLLLLRMSWVAARRIRFV